jgi:hypothetical protein
MLAEEAPTYTTRTLVAVGIPSFLIAVMVAVLTHLGVHALVGRSLLADGTVQAVASLNDHNAGPISSAAGTAWTFLFAVASFALYLRFPNNLFLGSLAFVNASIRIPQTVSVFLELLFTGKAATGTDEGTLLLLIRLTDPTLSVLLMCFFSLTILFLTITVIYDTRTIPWKWGVALALFLAIPPLDRLMTISAAPFLP